MGRKFLSRKFLVFLLCLIFAVMLKIKDKIEDLYFTIIFIVLFISYIFIQGVIDLNDLKKIKIKENELELRGKRK